MSDTPRIDAAVGSGSAGVLKVARELERELNKLSGTGTDDSDINARFIKPINLMEEDAVIVMLNEAAIHFESFPGGRDAQGMALLNRAIATLRTREVLAASESPVAGDGPTPRCREWMVKQVARRKSLQEDFDALYEFAQQLERDLHPRPLSYSSDAYDALEDAKDALTDLRAAVREGATPDWIEGFIDQLRGVINATLAGTPRPSNDALSLDRSEIVTGRRRDGTPIPDNPPLVAGTEPT